MRLEKDADSDAIFQKVKDGIVGNVSVGYMIHKASLVDTKDGVETYRVNDWEPLKSPSLPCLPMPLLASVAPLRMTAERPPLLKSRMKESAP